MGWEFADTTTPIAKKDYHCEASDWILGAGWNENDWTQDELTIIHRAQRERWKILSGTRYIKVTGKWEGEFTVFRAREDLDAICKKYGFYDDC